MIGNRLKEEREKLGATQAEMALKIGISAQYYSKIERGEESPSLATVIDIADTLDCSVDYLLGTGKQPTQIDGSLGKYLKRTHKGFVCTAEHCPWRDKNNVCHSGAGCLKEWEERHEH